MCLTRLDLSLSYNQSERAFVGQGYKCISDYNFQPTKYTIYNAGIKKYVELTRKPIYTLNKWVRSTGHFPSSTGAVHSFDPSSFECADYSSIKSSGSTFNSTEYYPGFHIFTNREPAELYPSTIFREDKVYRVLYKEVVAFGTNAVYGLNRQKTKEGKMPETRFPCVIAHYMKIVECLGPVPHNVSL